MGGFTPLVKFQFSHSQTDPILFDLSSGGTGVQLTSLAGSSAYFDLKNTGFAIHTGWVSSTTGILVNSSNPTSASNLIGATAANGFTALQSLDTNHDGVINSSDTGFSSLYIWEDTNGNGTADSGEVHTLSSLSITSINLNSSETNELVNGNDVGYVATFTQSGVSTHHVDDAFFDDDQMNSIYGGSYTLDPAVLVLPNARGYGTVPDLFIAMSQDSTLLGLVQDLAGDSISDAATFDQQVQDIIYRWAGVDGVDPTSQGDYINAQDLEALQAFLGETYTDYTGETYPLQARAYPLEQSYNTLFAVIKERLLAQGPLAQYLSGVTYDYGTDSLTGTTDFSALMTAIGANIPSDPATAVQYLAGMGQFMDQLATDLGVAKSTFDSTLATDFASAGLPLTQSTVDNLHYLIPNYNLGDVTFMTDTAGGIAQGVAGYNNILEVTSFFTNLPQLVFNDIQTLQADANATLTASEFDSFSNLTAGGSRTLTASGAGTFDLSGKTATAIFSLSANGDSSNVTLIGDNQNGETLTGGTGTDTLEAGNGTGDILIASTGATTMTGGSGGDTFDTGSGVDTITGGSGNDTFNVGTTGSGGSIDGGAGTDTVSTGANISGLTISNVETLNVLGSTTLTASEFNGFSTITGTSSLNTSGAGTFDLSSKTVTGTFNLSAVGDPSAVTLIGNNQNSQTLSAGSGTDTLTARKRHGRHAECRIRRRYHDGGQRR